MVVRESPQTSCSGSVRYSDVDGKLDFLFQFLNKVEFLTFLLLYSELADDEYARLLNDDDYMDKSIYH